MTSRAQKLFSLEAAARLVPDGATVAIGGLSYYGAPMALVRALIRRGARNLTVITAAVSGIQADLLISAGCVSRIISPYLALEELGLAPGFRRAAEKKAIEIIEVGEAFLCFGLKAAASGAPFYALPLALAASDCVRVNPLYKLARDPITQEEIVCVPPLRPDWTLLHAQCADAAGNLQYSGPSFMDGLLARASRNVIATCDELLSNESVRRQPSATRIPANLVKAVVHLPGAAWPSGSFGRYDVDRAELKRYAAACKTADSQQAYIAEIRAAQESESGKGSVSVVSGPAPSPADSSAPLDASAPPSRGEIMAAVISRVVQDGMFTGAGTGCWEVLAGLRLAQLTHAPNLSFTLGGSGAFNPEWPYLPMSLNGDEGLRACEAIVGLEELMDLELGGAFDILFASGLQIDAYGNLNLVCSGPYDRPALRGPGTVGLEFAGCVSNIVAFFRQHNRQTFVEKVEFISGIGYGQGPGSRARWGIPDSRGPRLVVTNLAVMDYCPETLRMRLKSVHPGVSVNSVCENTGFELIVPREVPETPLPSPQELHLLRTRIDRGGWLRKLVP